MPRGVLLVFDGAPRVWSADELQLLQLLTGQAAIAMEHARLLAIERRAREHLEQLTATLEERVAERTEEISRQQARTQAILDALGEGVFVTDLQGVIEYVNPACQTLTGYPAREAVGASSSLWRSPQTPRALYEQMWATILRGETWRGEIVNRRRDGAPLDAHLTIAPIRSHDESDRLTGFVGVLQDISPYKRAEAESRRALAQEKELSALKTRFISMTSHEFRTPLTTILSSTDLLAHYCGPSLEEKRLVHFQRIRGAVTNMVRLLDDVLVLGRGQAGRMEFHPAPLDLVAFCRDLVAEVRLAAGPAHSLQFVAAGGDSRAQADEFLLRQILTNLLSNALKYSPAGGAVRLTLTCGAGQATFQVQDEGMGIAEEDRPRLFETFHRGQNVASIPGTGLGLSIVKQAVDLHGGTIAVASRVGQGTTFTVSLPINRGG